MIIRIVINVIKYQVVFSILESESEIGAGPETLLELKFK